MLNVDTLEIALSYKAAEGIVVAFSVYVDRNRIPIRHPKHQ